MAARRKQALLDKDIDDILNGSEIEDAEDDEDPTYQEPEINKYAEENVFILGGRKLRSGDEISIASTSDFQNITRSVRNRSSVRTRGGVLHRSAVRSRVRTRGGAGASKVSLQDPIQWTRLNFRNDFPKFLQPSYPPSEPKLSIIEYFYEYIDEDLLYSMVTMSNQTALEKIAKSLNLTLGKCKAFVALTMRMGCIGYPQTRMYRSDKYAVPIIFRSLVRD